MKIVYLVDIDIKYNKGVVKKIHNQMLHWVTNGHSVELILISPDEGFSFETPSTPIKSFNSAVTFFPKKGMNIYYAKIKALRKIDQYLSTNKPDVIYFRCNMWIPGLEKILKKYPTVMEVNSKDLEEIKSWKPLMRSLYKYGRKKIINNLNGIVSVSNELAKEFQGMGIPNVVIANGTEIKKYVHHTNNGAATPNLVFVGSLEQSWQGLDKIINIASQLPELNFHIVGLHDGSINMPNLIFHGYLEQDALDALYKQMQIGVGSLALHRKKLYEASPLKVREYLNYRLPMIIGYDDTDLGENELILQIGNYEENVSDNVEKIREFVKVNAGKALPDEVVNLVSNTRKEQQRVSFFESIIQGQ